MMKVRLLLAAALAVAIASPCLAQDAHSSAANGPGSRSKWDIEFFAGGNGFKGGQLRPLTGAPVGPLFGTPLGGTTRAVSTWLMTPGQLSLALPTIQVLNPAVQTPDTRAATRALVGVRLTRWLRGPFGVEFMGSYAPGTVVSLSPLALQQVEASRASFEKAFAGLFAASPNLYGSPSVSAVTTHTPGSGSQLDAGGELTIAEHSGHVQPYLAAGAGIFVATGTPETVAVTGHYAFTGPGGAPIDETDNVTFGLRSSSRSVMLLVGGGFRIPITARASVRIDLTAYRASAGEETLLDIAPSSKQGSPAGVVTQPPGAGNGVIVFSNSPAQQTTLSGAAVSQVQAGKDSSFHWGWRITTGWVWSY